MAEGAQVTEISAAEKLTALRAEQPQYIMDSFGTICGYAEHGAIVHYSATFTTAFWNPLISVSFLMLFK